MLRILTHIQVPQPDFCHTAGQRILRPLSYAFGRSYVGSQASLEPSLAMRVMIAALAVLLIPISFVCSLFGYALLTYSKTHRRAYESLNITVTWKDNKPEICGSRVLLRPIQSGDLEAYKALFCNAETMAQYQGGARSPQGVEKRFNGWLERWKEHPFSALAVVDRETNKVFGHVVLGHGDYEGCADHGWSEGALILDPAYWNADYPTSTKGTAGKKGMGSEVARCMMAYIQSLKEKSIQVPVDVGDYSVTEREKIAQENHLRAHRGSDGIIDWVYLPLAEVRATARIDNPSHKILAQMLSEYPPFRARIEPAPKDHTRDRFVITV